MSYLIVFFIGAVIVFPVAMIPSFLRNRQLKKRLGASGSPLADISRDKLRKTDRKGLMLSLHYFLVSAGLRVSPLTFVMIPAVLAGAVGTLILVLTGQALFAGAVAAALLGAPAFYILWKREQMRKKIVMEMPDAVGMVTRALGIGMSVDAALKEAADNLDSPLGTEIKIIYREMAVGIPFTQAFQGFAGRYPSLPDVRLFCTAFVLQRETGGDLVSLLQSLSATIQDRFSFKRQIRAYTAEARMSALIISFLPIGFALVAWLTNPGYIEKLTATGLGRGMVYGAVFLEIAGFVVMRKMAQVKI